MLPSSTPDRVMDCLKGSLTSNACGEICQQFSTFVQEVILLPFI